MNESLLPNYVSSRWAQGVGPGIPLVDPVLGNELARVSSAGIEFEQAFAYARHTGSRELGTLTYKQRGKALSACVAVLKQNRERYLLISLENSGTATADSMIDVDGAIFTLNYFAKAGKNLGTRKFLRDRDGSLVCFIFGDGAVENASLALRLAAYHGRLHLVSPAVAKTQTGHGNAMPMSIHGGPGSGSELGGLRSFEFYHQRCAVQAENASLGFLSRASEWAY